MKHNRLSVLLSSICLVLVLLLTVILAACSPAAPATTAPAATTTAPAAPAEVIKLKASTYFTPVQPLGKAFEEFMKALQERSKGRVEITTFMGGTLTTTNTTYDGVVNGITDIGMTMIGYASSYVASHAVNDYFFKYMPKSFDETHMLSWFASPPSVLILSKPAPTLEAVKGMKIRGTATAGKIVTALGASPTATAAGEVYTSISRGVIDGILWPISTLEEWKLAELKPKITNCWQIGPVFAFYHVMNKKSWDKLTPDLQKIFTDTSMEWIDKYAANYDDADLKGYDMGQSAGSELFSLSAAELPKWQAAIKPLLDEYAASMVAKGFTDADIRAKDAYITERSKYWYDQQKKKGIKMVPGR